MNQNEKRDLSRMSWKEANLVLGGRPVVLVPVGTSEAQGPHNPVAADYLLAYEFARRVAEEADATFYLTGIPYGNSAAFRGFCGTVWLRPETLESLVRDICYSLVHHGFDHLIVVNNHGPNEPAIESALRRLRDERGIIVPVLWPSALAKGWTADLFEPESLGHGAEPMTSLMAHLVPDAVRLGALQDDAYLSWQGLVPQSSTRSRFENQSIGLYLDAEEYSNTAVRATPVGDSERGRLLMQHLVAFGKSFVARFREIDVHARGKREGE